MARSELIYDYLSDLEIYLSRVSEAQAQEVVQEIETHIFDSGTCLQFLSRFGGLYRLCNIRRRALRLVTYEIRQHHVDLEHKT